MAAQVADSESPIARKRTTASARGLFIALNVTLFLLVLAFFLVGQRVCVDVVKRAYAVLPLAEFTRARLESGTADVQMLAFHYAIGGERWVVALQHFIRNWIRSFLPLMLQRQLMHVSGKEVMVCGSMSFVFTALCFFLACELFVLEHYWILPSLAHVVFSISSMSWWPLLGGRARVNQSSWLRYGMFVIVPSYLAAFNLSAWNRQWALLVGGALIVMTILCVVADKRSQDTVSQEGSYIALACFAINAAPIGLALYYKQLVALNVAPTSQFLAWLACMEVFKFTVGILATMAAKPNTTHASVVGFTLQVAEDLVACLFIAREEAFSTSWIIMCVSALSYDIFRDTSFTLWIVEHLAACSMGWKIQLRSMCYWMWLSQNLISECAAPILMVLLLAVDGLSDWLGIGASSFWGHISAEQRGMRIAGLLILFFLEGIGALAARALVHHANMQHFRRGESRDQWLFVAPATGRTITHARGGLDSIDEARPHTPSNTSSNGGSPDSLPGVTSTARCRGCRCCSLASHLDGIFFPYLGEAGESAEYEHFAQHWNVILYSTLWAVVGIIDGLALVDL